MCSKRYTQWHQDEVGDDIWRESLSEFKYIYNFKILLSYQVISHCDLSIIKKWGFLRNKSMVWAKR